MRFETKRAAAAPDAIAPDGSEVRVLCQGARGGTFTAAKTVARAVADRIVGEIWCVISGRGRMWRELGEH